MGEYLSQSDSTKNIVVYYGGGGEEKLLWNFRKGLETLGMKPASFPTIDLSKATRDSLRNMLSLVDRNNLILLSTNEVKMASLMRAMAKWSEDAYMVGYVPSGWKSFKNVEMDYFDAYRIHRPEMFHVDYEMLEVQYFVQQFRELYKTEPSTFAFRGYDLANHLIKNLSGIHEEGPAYLEKVIESGLQTNFHWKRVADGGLENAAPKMVDYTNYQLKIATD